MIFTAVLPILGKFLSWLGISRFPQKYFDFYEKTGQMLIDDKRKSKKVSFVKCLTV